MRSRLGDCDLRGYVIPCQANTTPVARFLTSAASRRGRRLAPHCALALELCRRPALPPQAVADGLSCSPVSAPRPAQGRRE